MIICFRRLPSGVDGRMPGGENGFRECGGVLRGSSGRIVPSKLLAPIVEMRVTSSYAVEVSTDISTLPVFAKFFGLGEDGASFLRSQRLNTRGRLSLIVVLTLCLRIVEELLLFHLPVLASGCDVLSLRLDSDRLAAEKKCAHRVADRRLGLRFFDCALEIDTP